MSWCVGVALSGSSQAPLVPLGEGVEVQVRGFGYTYPPGKRQLELAVGARQAPRASL